MIVIFKICFAVVIRNARCFQIKEFDFGNFQRALRSSAFEHFRLSTVEKLLGTAQRASGVIVLGMLTQRDADTYQIEDLTGKLFSLQGFQFCLS